MTVQKMPTSRQLRCKIVNLAELVPTAQQTELFRSRYGHPISRPPVRA